MRFVIQLNNIQRKIMLRPCLLAIFDIIVTLGALSLIILLSIGMLFFPSEMNVEAGFTQYLIALFALWLRIAIHYK